jgi:DNA-binding NarL/FixJ family response regulator
VIKVFVCANSTTELAGLEALVRSDPLLRLVGSSLGRVGLRQLLADGQPDVLLEHVALDELQDLRWPDLNAKTTARVLLVTQPEFSRATAGIETEERAIRGVLPIWATEREIQVAIEAAAEGLLVFHPEVVENFAMPGIPSLGATASFPQQLSPREGEILNLVATGLGNKQIAAQLKISEHTVKFHVTSIFNKLSVSSRAEAVAVGIRRGLIVL